MVNDEAATPFNRLWCCIEMMMAVKSHKLVDFYASFESQGLYETRRFVGMCDGPAEVDLISRDFFNALQVQPRVARRRGRRRSLKGTGVDGAVAAEAGVGGSRRCTRTDVGCDSALAETRGDTRGHAGTRGDTPRNTRGRARASVWRLAAHSLRPTRCRPR